MDDGDEGMNSIGVKLNLLFGLGRPILPRGELFSSRTPSDVPTGK